jgi:hypothetical protein
MLAAAIRIDRPVEGNVGSLVTRDDGAGLLDGDLGPKGRQGAQGAPAIIFLHAADAIIAGIGVERRAATALPFRIEPMASHRNRIARHDAG